MRVRIANAPVSWGVFFGDDPTNPPWAKVLDEIAGAGYRWTELGPIGYLPEDPAELSDALASRDLSLIGGFIYEPLHDPSNRHDVLEIARRTCRALAPQGAKYFVIIDRHSAARAATTGRSDAAPRLEGQAWADFMETIGALATIARDHGLAGVLHPHAACYVEFADEIDRALADLDPGLVGICMDTGHLAYAGVDPIAFYRRHHARVPYFHFKNTDGTARRRALAEKLEFFDAISAGVFCALPDGVVDFRDLKTALEETGFDGWATIEQDNDPRQGSDPVAGAVANLAYLRGIGLVA